MTPPQRRSTRLQNKRLALPPQIVDQHTQANASGNGKCSKRRKTQTPNASEAGTSTTHSLESIRSTKKGELRVLLEIPLEILFEIFSWLFPQDLLRLSRTTKSFRKILMRPSSKPIWKSALMNARMPDCPAELCEPEYASLAFDAYCHLCGVSGARTYHWLFFRRVCKRCHQTAQHGWDGDEINEALAKRNLTQGEIARINSDKGFLGIFCPAGYLRTEFEELMDEYVALEGQTRRNEWAKAKAKEFAERLRFADSFELWWQQWKNGDIAQIVDLRGQRRTEILELMKKEGWGNVIDNMNHAQRQNFALLEAVNQPRNLTDRTWKTIKPAIVKLFRVFQGEQLAKHRRQYQEKRFDTFKVSFEEYCHSHPPDAFVPSIAHVIAIEGVQNLLFPQEWDHVPSQADFISAFSRTVPQLGVKVKAELDSHLYRLVDPESYVSDRGKNSKNSVKVDTSRLLLATSLFMCKDCTTAIPLSYTQIPFHKHQRGNASVRQSEGWTYQVKECYTSFNCSPVLATSFELADQVRIRGILKVCGLDEETAAMDELEKMDPILRCTQPQWCGHGPGSSTRSGFYFWPVQEHATYWNYIFPRDNGRRPQFQFEERSVELLNYEKLLARNYQTNAWDDLRLVGRKLFGCKYCYCPTPLSFDILQEHLSSRHDVTIQSREAMEHYVLHPMVGRKIRSTPYLYPRNSSSNAQQS